MSAEKEIVVFRTEVVTSFSLEKLTELRRLARNYRRMRVGLVALAFALAVATLACGVVTKIEVLAVLGALGFCAAFVLLVGVIDEPNCWEKLERDLFGEQRLVIAEQLEATQAKAEALKLELEKARV